MTAAVVFTVSSIMVLLIQINGRSEAAPSPPPTAAVPNADNRTSDGCRCNDAESEIGNGNVGQRASRTAIAGEESPSVAAAQVHRDAAGKDGWPFGLSALRKDGLSAPATEQQQEGENLKCCTQCGSCHCHVCQCAS